MRASRLEGRHSKWWDTLREFCQDEQIPHLEDRIFAIVCEALDEDAAIWAGANGGRKGGRARAEALTSEERSVAASHAARVRWNRSK